MDDPAATASDPASIPATAVRSGWRARVPDYPAAVWWMVVCTLILWIGRGMVIRFLIIFFTEIVGLSGSLVGIGISVTSMAGILFVLAFAGVIDRRGGHPVLIACLLIFGLAVLGHTIATSLWLFLLMTLIMNMAGQMYWSASDTTIASLISPDRIAVAISSLRIANAIGTGIGGIIGGLIVSNGGVAEYRILFIVSAALVVTAGVLVRVCVPNQPLPSRNVEGAHGTWRDVRLDRLFLTACALLMLLILGLSQMQVTIPVVLLREAGVGEGMIGTLFAINTILMILLQLPLAERVDRGNIMRLLAVSGLLWALAFGIMPLTSTAGLPVSVLVILLLTAGQLLFVPATAIIPMRLAPPHLRGRYFSLLNVGWGAAYAVAALLGGVALDLPNTGVIWPILAAGMVLVAIGALRLHGEARLKPPAPQQPLLDTATST